jgi:hypothetical protein
MTPESKSPKQPQDVKDANIAPRRKYAAPRLKRLGSVRDLTLGSPLLPFGDGKGGFQRTPPM